MFLFSSFLSLLVGLDKRIIYVGTYGSNIVKVFSRPLSKASNLTTNILWWYRFFSYGGLCPIYFSNELGSCDSIFVL